MIGTTLLNRYKIDSELGKGGMGVVYKAHDTLLHRAVAIKFLNTDGISTEGRSRLIQEARAAAQLNHPNIISVFDAGETEGNPFIVMEFIPGNTLKGITTPSVSEVLVMATQICKALDHAHSKGIIHRDLKLENIIVTDTQTLKLMDFGLARSSDDSRMTEEGVLKGTLAYIAPELIQGESASPQSDLYAFGVILYELLTGHAPFEGTVNIVLAQHLHGIVAPPSEYNVNIPEWVDDLVFQLLAKHPEERHASARDVLQDIEERSTAPTFTSLISIAPRPKNNLPTQLTTFIGREREVEQVKKRLEKNHLVTLTGSGGIGKTRLSIQVASELLAEYPIGVWLVELAPLTDPALVPQSICSALRVTTKGGTSALDVLINYMHEKKILLVMDNCEHLIDACAQLCHSLLHACPELRIIASSREALGIEGEIAYRVPSLSLPNPISGLHVIEESEAVQLFVERAITIFPEFKLNEANTPVVAQICQRLDGIALAIELAASRVKILKVEQIATRLDDAFRLLTGGSRTALPRQQTLRALIDWSYNLLTEEEKIILRRLSVFMGGWTLETAEVVCENTNILDLMTRLVDKSLVSVEFEHNDETRYYLLETVRQYAYEKLLETGEMENVCNQHLKAFIELAEKAEPEIRGFNQLVWLNQLDEELDNLRTALSWAKTHDNHSFLRLACALWRFWDIRGHFADLEWLPNALASTEGLQSILRAQAFGRAAFVASNHGDLQRGKVWAKDAENLSRALGYKLGLAMALNLLSIFETVLSKKLSLAGRALALAKEMSDSWLVAIILIASYTSVFHARNELVAARSFLEQGVWEARSIGDKRLIGLGVRHLGMNALVMGDAIKAEKCLREALSYAYEMKDDSNIYLHHSSIIVAKIFLEDNAGAREMVAESFKLAQISNAFMSQTYLNSAWIDVSQGNISRAGEQMEEGLRLAKLTNNMYSITNITLGLAETLRRSKDFDQAAARYGEALVIIQKESIADSYCDCLDGLGMLAINKGLFKEGVWLLGAMKKIHFSAFAVDFPFMVREREAHIAVAREQLSESEFNAAWAEGQSMSQEQVLALAMEAVQ